MSSRKAVSRSLVRCSPPRRPRDHYTTQAARARDDSSRRVRHFGGALLLKYRRPPVRRRRGRRARAARAARRRRRTRRAPCRSRARGASARGGMRGRRRERAARASPPRAHLPSVTCVTCAARDRLVAGWPPHPKSGSQHQSPGPCFIAAREATYSVVCCEVRSDATRDERSARRVISTTARQRSLLVVLSAQDRSKAVAARRSRVVSSFCSLPRRWEAHAEAAGGGGVASLEGGREACAPNDLRGSAARTSAISAGDGEKASPSPLCPSTPRRAAAAAAAAAGVVATEAAAAAAAPAALGEPRSSSSRILAFGKRRSNVSRRREANNKREREETEPEDAGWTRGVAHAAKRGERRRARKRGGGRGGVAVRRQTFDGGLAAKDEGASQSATGGGCRCDADGKETTTREAWRGAEE